MRTTKKNFDLFKAECKKWIARFELSGWNITFYWEDLTRRNHWAEARIDLNGRTMNLAFTTYITDEQEEMTNNKIRSVAKHECIHALLGRFSQIAEARFVDASEILEAEEELVYKLEKIIK